MPYDRDPLRPFGPQPTPEDRLSPFQPRVGLDEPLDRPRPLQPRRRPRRWLPLVLFLFTCVSTWFVGGLPYSVVLMTILLFHELGHYLQARRYRVPTSLPFFIPMPISPIGTMGAIIGMRAQVANARALFDIAITGPLAGLVPTLIASIWGLSLSRVVPAGSVPGVTLTLGEPLLFKGLSYLIFGPLPEGETVYLHPVAFAGWVGILLTALNLTPIGQLDGGHILYALMKKKAHRIAEILLLAAVVAIAIGGYWGWLLMVVLLLVIGPRHPPTADDAAPLGRTRIVLGWVTLAFFFVGMTPTPLVLPEGP